MSIEVMRLLQLAAHREHISRIEVRVHDDVANYLLNRKRKEIAQLEEAGEKQVPIRGSAGRVAGVPGVHLLRQQQQRGEVHAHRGSRRDRRATRILI